MSDSCRPDLGRFTGMGGARLSYLECRSGEKFVLKQWQPGQSKKRDHEAKALLICGGIGLPKLVETGICRGEPYLVYTFMEGEPAAEVKRPLTRQEWDNVSFDLLTAISSLHLLGLIHYDISASNVVVNLSCKECSAGLIDVGHSDAVGLSGRGTPGYMSPEMYRGVPGDCGSDLFSIGVVLTELALGERVVKEDTARVAMSRFGEAWRVSREKLNNKLGAERTGILGKLLSDRLEERPKDALEVLEQLLDIDGGAKARGRFADAAASLARLVAVSGLRTSMTVANCVSRVLKGGGKSDTGPQVIACSGEVVREAVVRSLLLELTLSGTCVTTIRGGAGCVRTGELWLVATTDNFSTGGRYLKSGNRCDTEDVLWNVVVEPKGHAEGAVLDRALTVQVDSISGYVDSLELSDIDSNRLEGILALLPTNIETHVFSAMRGLVNARLLRRAGDSWLGLGADAEWVRAIASEVSEGGQSGLTRCALTDYELGCGARQLFLLESGEIQLSLQPLGSEAQLEQGRTVRKESKDSKDSKERNFSLAFLAATLEDQERGHRVAANVVADSDKLQALHHRALGHHAVLGECGEVIKFALWEGHVLRGRLLCEAIERFGTGDTIAGIDPKIRWLALEVGYGEDFAGAAPFYCQMEENYFKFCEMRNGRSGRRYDIDNDILPTFAALARRIETCERSELESVGCEVDSNLYSGVLVEIPESDIALGGNTVFECERERMPFWRVHSLLTCLSAAGKRYWLEGEFLHAEKYFEIGMRAAKGLGSKMWAGRFALNLGNCALGREDGALAIRSYDDAFKTKMDIGDYIGAARAVGNAGIAELEAGQADSAAKRWQRQVMLLKRSRLPNGLAKVVARLGVAYQEMGDIKQAEGCIAEARRLAMRYDDQDAKFMVDVNEAELQLSLGKVGNAALLLKGLRLDSSALPQVRLAKLDELEARIAIELGQVALVEAYSLKYPCEVRGSVSDGDSVNERRGVLCAMTRAIGVRVGSSTSCSSHSEWAPRGFASEAALAVFFAHSRAAGLVQCDLLDVARRLHTGPCTLDSIRAWQMLGNLALEEALGRARWQNGLVRELDQAAKTARCPGLEWRTRLLLSCRAMRREDWVIAASEFLRALQVYEECHWSGDVGDHGLSVGSGYGWQWCVLVWEMIRARVGSDSNPHELKAHALMSVRSEAVRFLGKVLGEARGGATSWTHGLQRVLSVAQELNTDADIEKLLDQIVTSLLEVCDGDNGFVVLFDSRGRMSVSLAKSANGPSGAPLSDQVSSTIVGQVARSRSAVLIKNVLDDESLLFSQSVKSLDLHAAMCAPLLHRGELLGAVYVDNRSACGAFDESDLQLLEVYANQAAVAIQNRKMIGDLRRLYGDLSEAHERIVKSEKLRAIGEMASGVAHDFNNLLTAILVRAQMLSETASDLELKRELGCIEKAAVDGASVVRRIQSYTRARSEADYEVFGVKDVIDGAVLFVEPRLRRDQAADELAVRILVGEVESGEIYGNPSEVREVLTNLLINAADAMGGVGVVRVTSSRVANRVRIRVEDSGVGIPADTLQKVFDPFFSTKGANGNGLGLSVAQGIVARHGGSISVESVVGSGSVFSVELPLHEANEVIRHACSFNVRPRDSLRVLLVDDDERVRSGVGSALRQRGMTVMEAECAKRALESLAECAFDWVVSDHNMPGMSGLELHEEMQRTSSEARFVLISGSMGDRERFAAGVAGIESVLAKPFDFEVLCEILLGKRHGH